MKKILVIITVALDYNGISMVAMNYLRKMNVKEYQITCLVKNIQASDLKDELISMGMECIEYPFRNRNPFGYMLKLLALMKQNKYDVVHVHGNSATMVTELLPAKYCKIPVRIAHSHSSSCEHQWAHALLFPLFQISYNQAIACSEQSGKWLFRDKNYLLLNNAFALEKYAFSEEKRVEYREKLNLNDSFVMGHLGNYDEVKNHPFLFQIFEEVLKIEPSAKLILVGAGTKMDYYIEQMKEKKLFDHILFLGKRMDVLELLSVMDVFVFPSFYEGLSLSLLEAQSTGLPCLASDSISVKHKFGDTTTFASIEQTAMTWAKEIIVKQIGIVERKQNSRQIIERLEKNGYSIEKNVQCLCDVYNQ